MNFVDGCSICLEDYSHSRIPQMIRCGHTFCNICIETMIHLPKECPLCRAPFLPSTINLNIDFIRNIFDKDKSHLLEIKSYYKENLELLIEKEVSATKHILNELAKLENEILCEIRATQAKIETLIEEIQEKKRLKLAEIDNDIDSVIRKLENETQDYTTGNIRKVIQEIEQKYSSTNTSFSVPCLVSTEFFEDLQTISNTLTKVSNLQIHMAEVPVFTKSVVLAPMPEPGRFAFSNLFDPLPGFLNLYNISTQKVTQFANEHIQTNSTVFQLHQSTVCILTDNTLLYLDTEKSTFYEVKQKKNIKGFCVGRFHGDLMVIGGEIQGGAFNNKRKVFMRLNRKKWVSQRTLRVERVYATAESIHNRVYVIGGNPDMSIEYFNGDFWNLLPVKLSHNWLNVLTCSHGKKIYLLGGQGSKNKNNLVSELDLEKNSITEIGYMKENAFKGYDSSAVFYDNKIYYNFGDQLFVFHIENYR